MAANLGFRVPLAHDACAAFTGNADMSWRAGAAAPDSEAIHCAALSHLHGEFAKVAHSSDLIAK